MALEHHDPNLFAEHLKHNQNWAQLFQWGNVQELASRFVSGIEFLRLGRNSALYIICSRQAYAPTSRGRRILEILGKHRKMANCVAIYWQ